MPNVTITTTDVWLPEVWSTLMLEVFSDMTVMRPLVTDYSAWARTGSKGDIIHVPTGLANIAARTLTNMTGTITFDAATEAQTTINVNTFSYTANKIDEAAFALNPLSLLDLYTTELGRSQAEKFDTDLMTEADGTTNEKGVDNVAISDDVILESREVLDANNNPYDGRSFVVSAETYNDLFKIDKFVNQLTSASVGNLDGSKGRGYVGPVYEAKVYVSNNIPAGAAGNKNFYFQKSGLGYAINSDVEVTFREPHDEFAKAVRARMIYGVKRMRAASVIEVAAR